MTSESIVLYRKKITTLERLLAKEKKRNKDLFSYIQEKSSKLQEIILSKDDHLKQLENVLVKQKTELITTRNILSTERKNFQDIIKVKDGILKDAEVNHLGDVELVKKRLQQAADRENRQTRKLVLLNDELKRTTQALDSERKAVEELILDHCNQLKSIHEQHNTKISFLEDELKNKLLNEQELRLAEKHNFNIQLESIHKKFASFLIGKEAMLSQPPTITEKQRKEHPLMFYKPKSVDTTPSKLRESHLINMRKRRIMTKSEVAKRSKPKLPVKNAKILSCKIDAAEEHHSYVKDVIRRLQEKENNENAVNAIKPSCGPNVNLFSINELSKQETSNQTIEDIKAIDADIERLRCQIADRDRIITEQDSMIQTFQLENFRERNMLLLEENSRLKTDYETLQESYNRLESDLRYCQVNRTEENSSLCLCKKNVNLVVVQELAALREKEANLMAENAEFRDKIDLLEFRLLELEHTSAEENNHHRQHSGLQWSDREIEDISDSGIMSLPTSEDLTSDSDLGEGLNHLSSESNKLTGVATVFPSVIGSYLDEKSKGNDILGKSIIFDDVNSLKNSNKICQGETRPFATISRLKVPDLSTEISKLSEIQKRIQKTDYTDPRSSRSPGSCHYTDSVAIYEEKIAQLESKLNIYESSGTERELALKRRLDREIFLECENKELRERVHWLEGENRRLDEERCEYEEAENDARLHCQRLEVKIQGLIDTKAELESQLRQKLGMAGDGSTKFEEELKKCKIRCEEMELRATTAENQLKEYQSLIWEEKLHNWSPNDRYEDMQQLIENDAAFRKKIAEHEATEKAFMQTLQQADEIWASMEAEYKKKLVVAEEQMKLLMQEKAELQINSEVLMDEMRQLKLNNQVLNSQVALIAENSNDKLESIKDLEKTNIKLREELNSILQMKNTRNEMIEQKNAQEEIYRKKILDTVQSTESKIMEMNALFPRNEIQQKLTLHENIVRELTAVLQEKEEKLAAMEKDFAEKISELSKEVSTKTALMAEQTESIKLLNDELEKKTKEIMNLEVNASELKEEVETLELSQSAHMDETTSDSQSELHGKDNSRDASQNSDIPPLLPSRKKSVNFSDEDIIKEYTPSIDSNPSSSPVPPYLPQGQLESVEGENRLLNLTVLPHEGEEIIERNVFSQCDQKEDHQIQKYDNGFSSPPCTMRQFDHNSAFSLTTLQIALDNLRIKSRCKQMIINEVLMQHLKKNNFRLLCKSSSIKPAIDAISILTESSDAPSDVQSSEFEDHVSGMNLCRKVSDLWNMFAITKICRTPSGALLVEWDSSRQLPEVIGYEICINGKLQQTICSPYKQNILSALLYPSHSESTLVISVHAMSVSGRTPSKAIAVFPPLRI